MKFAAFFEVLRSVPAICTLPPAPGPHEEIRMAFSAAGLVSTVSGVAVGGDDAVEV